MDTTHRFDKTLIDIVKEFGKKASGQFSTLIVSTIPEEYYKNDFYEIHEYDGMETILLNEDAMKYFNLYQEAIK